ncbi:MAG: Lipid A export ATP-binding/permease protein MsbA [Chlamydiales bacterium]|nr:Lipid A export ATP-binding/permease protein MsbA [Chlamydiales bacterium]
MKLLLKAAFLNRKHYALLLVTVCAMFLLTLGSQMEMFALGVVAKTGPDFFTLFGKESEGKLQMAQSLTPSDVTSRWDAIAPSPGGPINIDEANAYMSAHGGISIVQKVAAFLDSHFAIHTNLTRLAFILVFVAIFKALALFLHRYFTQLVAIRVSRDLRQQYFEHIQSLPLSFYHDYDIGSLSSRVSGDAGVVASAINSLLLNYIQAPFAVVSTLIACFLISWKLSLVIFVGFPLIVFPIVFIARKIKAISKQMQRNHEKFSAVLLDFLSGIMTVKVFAMEAFSLKKYREQNNRMAKLEERSARFGTAARPILHSVSSLFFAAVILCGLYLFRLGPAELLVFCGLLYVFYEPVKKFAEENNNIFRGVAAAERMYEVLDIESTIQDAPDAIELNEFQEGIEFRDVSFRYRDEWILKNLSFSVKKGETVALVGPTGAGKSTIAKLLPRLYDTQQGEILIDGKSLRAYTQKSIRERIAFVPQKSFLFFDTIRENISFGRKFTDQQIQAAARSAHAEEFIVKLPDSYDFKLEEAGKNLSGGQQQRLAIARALVKGAPILVMDEATSSLDAVSEGMIRDAICELHGKLTQVIIAHRFSTIEHADRIIYLEKGTKVAEGPKERLLESCPNFRRMYEMMHASERL